MRIGNVDVTLIKEFVMSMANYLEKNKSVVDALNVFPVPDGDTGTNMHLTIQAAVREITDANFTDISEASKAAANGSLLGARGNSGVIVSQLLRGFSEGLKGNKEFTTKVFAEALKSSSDMAYSAVMKPVEGTILTVARESAEKALEIYDKTDDVTEFLGIVIEQAKDALRRTPEMLEVLKQSGVVDAGGQGYVFLLEGAYLYLKGEKIEDIIVEKTEIKETSDELNSFIREEDIKFAYCTEFIINRADISQADLIKMIEKKGDSLVCIKNEDLIKVHIHTNEPGYILHLAGKYGELINIKIDNMRKQFRDQRKLKIQREHKKNSFISISMGEGIKKVFEDLGVEEVISGGQTMNPSTEDILRAVESVYSDYIFILPNNSNIILAANQAKEISDKSIYVIPTKTIPQGISALLAFDDSVNPEINVEAMTQAMEQVKTGLVTFAVRDTTVNEKEIKTGDIIAIHDGNITANGNDITEQTIELINTMMDEDSSLITLFYGSDVTDKDAENLRSKVEEIAPDCDIEVINGGQPLYFYIISVE
ncbi:MAG: DAK2 domain-containing protein [Tissierellales bacterium]|nr:DAK2 domain-containing protein [Tissierellales bacterium]MBN2827703.1 DAK2 domain-containing protein [Tissierellales bacterium]